MKCIVLAAILAALGNAAFAQQSLVMVPPGPKTEGTRKVRFVDAIPSKTQYAALALAPRSSIALFHCMECEDSGLLRWNPKQKAFAWVRSRRTD